MVANVYSACQTSIRLSSEWCVFSRRPMWQTINGTRKPAEVYSPGTDLTPCLGAASRSRRRWTKYTKLPTLKPLASASHHKASSAECPLRLVPIIPFQFLPLSAVRYECIDSSRLVKLIMAHHLSPSNICDSARYRNHKHGAAMTLGPCSSPTEG